VGAVALSALLFGLAFPPLRLHALAWVALAPLFLTFRGAGPKGAMGLAVVWSVLAAYGVGDWMPRAVVTYYEQHAVVGWTFFFGCALLMAAPYYAAAAWVIQRLGRRLEGRGSGARAMLPLLVAAAWTAAELGRGRLFTGSSFFIGNPWALIGYSQVGVPAAIQVASLAGVYGVGFAVAAANAGLAEAFRARRAGLGAAVRPLLVGLLPGALALGGGALVLRQADDPQTPAVGVAVVQADLALGTRWRSDFYGRNLAEHLDLTRDAFASGDPRLVVWPESAMTFFLEEEPHYAASIAEVLADERAWLLAGGPRRTAASDPHFLNAVYAVDPEGRIRGRYDKEYLVPFAEFFPLHSVELLRRRFQGARSFARGGPPHLLPTPMGPAAVVICNEAMLPEVVGERVRAGAALIVNPSNDTWIPEPRFAEQQLDIVALRAVEQRRWLVRASSSGPSALVDPFGRVVGRTSMGESRVLVGSVRPRRALSLYARVGDGFAFACLGAVALALLVPDRSAPPVRRRRLLGSGALGPRVGDSRRPRMGADTACSRSAERG